MSTVLYGQLWSIIAIKAKSFLSEIRHVQLQNFLIESDNIVHFPMTDMLPPKYAVVLAATYFC